MDGDVVAGNDQPAGVRAACELDADARAGRVPGPLRSLRLRGDLARRGPREAVVVAGRDPDGARALGGAQLDRLLGVGAEVVRHAAARCGRSAGRSTGHGLPQVFSPSSQTICCAPNVLPPSVERLRSRSMSPLSPPPVLAALGEGEDVPALRHDRGGDAIGVVAALPDVKTAVRSISSAGGGRRRRCGRRCEAEENGDCA